MNITCKNCHNNFKGHYCNNCGQSAETHEINIHYVWHDIQHGLLHFDKGILYSGKELFTRPGHSIREFIEGKRIRHFKPISLVIVLATLYGFLYHYFHIDLMSNPSENPAEAGFDMKSFNEWTGTHYAWVTLATIPFYTIGTSIAFRKQGYNIAEYFILNTFKASQRLFVHLSIFPLYYYFNGTPEVKTLTLIIYLVDVIFIYWTNEQFFNKLSLIKTFFLTLLSQLIFLTCFTLTIWIILEISKMMT